jgi:nitrogen fixation-related uncharacterized protein
MTVLIIVGLLVAAFDWALVAAATRFDDDDEKEHSGLLEEDE